MEWKREQEKLRQANPDHKDEPPPEDVFIDPLFKPVSGAVPGLLRFRSHRYKERLEAAVDLHRYARHGSSVHAFLGSSTYL